jgi:hypothetical protein
MSTYASAAARERLLLRSFAASLGTHPALTWCGTRLPRGNRGSANEVRLLTAACKKRWLCATCGHWAAAHEYHRVRTIAERWTENGGCLAMLTLTQAHSKGDSLSELWSHLEAGWKSVSQGSGWQADRRVRGLRGYIRVTEVVHHRDTGWNVHFHVCLLMDGMSHRTELADSITSRFARGVRVDGGRAHAHCQELTPFPPGGERALASYCCKGTTPRKSANGSRTPLAILGDLRSSGDGANLWREFTDEVVARKRRHVSCSTHIDDRCPTTLL